MATLRPETVVVRSARPLKATVDDEMVMLDPDSGAYFGLDATARTIWDQLGTPSSIASLCDRMSEQFEVTADECLPEVSSFVAELVSTGMAETTSATT